MDELPSTGVVTADRDGVHGAARPDQPARRGRVGEVQRGAHPGRDDGARDRHPHRLLRHGAGRGRHQPDHDLRGRRRQGPVPGRHRGDSVAFFAMVGFEDSVNMVEEVQEPQKIFPRTMLTGLGVAVIIYMLVAVAVVTVLTPDELADDQRVRGSGAPRGRRQGCPGPPDGPDLPVPRGLRGRQHRPHQHADGQPAALRHGPAGRPARGRWARCRPAAGRRTSASCSPPLLALGLIWFVATAVGLLDRRCPVGHDVAAAARASSPWSTWPAWSCGATRPEGFFRSPGPTPAIAGGAVRLPDRPADLRPRHPRVPDRRSPWSASAWCCGPSPGSPTAASAPRRPGSATSSTWRTTSADVGGPVGGGPPTGHESGGGAPPPYP